MFFGKLRLSRRSAGATTHVLVRVHDHLRCLTSIKLNCLALSQLSSALSNNRDRHVGLSASLNDGLANSLCVLSRPSVNLRPHSAGQLVGILERLHSLNGAIVIIRRRRRIVHTTSCVISVNPGTNCGNNRIIFDNALPRLLGGGGDLATSCLANHHTVTPPTTRHK